MLTKTLRFFVFFLARAPSKLVFNGATGAFRKKIRFSRRKWVAQNKTNRGASGSAGGRIPEGEESGLLPAPP